MHPVLRCGKLLSDNCVVLCHVAFPTDSKICGVVNNDLILFSMLVIYFKNSILVYFLSGKCVFCTATMRV